MLKHPLYLGYPLPALLYDAKSGNTHSRLLVFDYLANLLERGQPVPADIGRFFAEQLRLVLDGKQEPKQMFNPEGKKGRVYNPLPADLLASGIAGGGDIKEKFGAIGYIQFRSEDRGKTVEKHYYDHKKYSRRLSDIQELLDERQATTDHERASQITAELARLVTPS